MGAVMRPGPATMRGLEWLAGVGPVSHPAWAAAMGWGPSATFRHAARLIDVGWAERQAMTRGDGSLIYATRAGVAVSGVRATVLTAPPAPTTWAHCEACGWVAAWLTARGRHMIGPRELLAGVEWQGQLRWREHGSERARGHRPDLLAAITPEGPLMPVEVELATKSHARLHAVLALHARWVASGKARALIYVCGDTQLADRVRGTAEPLGLDETRRTLRIELLDVIRDAAARAEPVRERVR
jgi:hypothetical protein